MIDGFKQLIFLPMVVALSLIEICTLTIFSGENELSRAYQKLGSPLNVGMYPRDSLLSYKKTNKLHFF